MSALIDEALALRARYDEEPSHSDHVANLALEIFDGLRGWHRLDDGSRDLLHAAALLHDIGWSQTSDGRGHHKWSAKLIREYPWTHLGDSDVAIVAQIARYHRKALPKPGHTDFHTLPAPARKTVMTLGGILRVADALDRTHTARVTAVDACFAGDAIRLTVEPDGNWQAERDMFECKRDLLQLAAGCPVKVAPRA